MHLSWFLAETFRTHQTTSLYLLPLLRNLGLSSKTGLLDCHLLTAGRWGDFILFWEPSHCVSCFQLGQDQKMQAQAPNYGIHCSWLQQLQPAIIAWDRDSWVAASTSDSWVSWGSGEVPCQGGLRAVIQQFDHGRDARLVFGPWRTFLQLWGSHKFRHHGRRHRHRWTCRSS